MTNTPSCFDQQPDAGAVRVLALIAVNHKRASTEPLHQVPIEGLARHGVMRIVPSKPEVLHTP
jgi:hypothetical protein